jgi:NADH-quinone oxidoreductase subunit F
MRLLPDVPVSSLDDYLAAGGGQGLLRALDMDAPAVRAEVAGSGLRGRGGAGFPTGTKWTSVVDAAAADGSTVHLVCNAAEGEPGTYKDRLLLARNPYQLVEGALIARHATQARSCTIGVKQRFTREVERLGRAIAEAVEAGWAGADEIDVVTGPDEYLFGEESAMIEVIEHKLPMPRILPPYMQGLWATMESPNPTVVNNVETLSHVAQILARGAAWFREEGTEETPGTMLFTVIGDVGRPGVWELGMGTSLRHLLLDLAQATDILAVYSGTSNTVITPDLLDLPLDFDSFREAGTGLGSGGFVVYDTSRCIVQVTAMLARFLGVESCGQCPPCKLHGMAIAELLDKLVRGEGTTTDLEDIRKRCALVTEANRCYLPVGHALLVRSTMDAFPGAFEDRLTSPSPAERSVPVPKIDDLDVDAGTVVLDPDYHRKQPDWSYLPR